MDKIKVLSVNISKQKGTVKQPIDIIELYGQGVLGDAHAGNWHRQVSLLGIESINRFETTLGRKLHFGEFAENITTDGYPLYLMKPFDKLISDNIVLEVTQIGKKCHGEKCNIFKESGDCIMPKEGIFCRVLKGGSLKAGDMLEYHPKIFKVLVITLSDRASQGLYEDKSGPLLKQLVSDYFTAMDRTVKVESCIIPDDKQQLTELVGQSVDSKTDIVFTTGGTGIGPKDITPEVIKPMLDKEIPGIMELIRVKYGMQTPNALISRSIAGVIGKTLIYALPGSTKAVKEYTDEIFKTVEHSLRMIYNIDYH